jgi:Protein of unknown function (DUF3179)
MSTLSPPNQQLSIGDSGKQTAGSESRKRSPPLWLWCTFLLSAFVAISLFAVPAFVIQPFRYQSPRALRIAMAVRERAPLGTLIAGLACLLIAFSLWKNASRLRQIGIASLLLIVASAATMARLNYFEWMFHPIDAPHFLAQSESKLDSKEMVMAINFADDARAYPIRQMAYHHILNDVVLGSPVVVTY